MTVLAALSAFVNQQMLTKFLVTVVLLH